MATKKYYLDDNKTDILQCSWGVNWKNFKIEYNNQIIVNNSDRKSLLNGITICLTPDKTLYAKLKQGLTQELELLINGQPIKGSATDPVQQIRLAFALTLIIGGINIFLGLLALITNNQMLLNLGLGMGSLVFGVVILVLAFGIKKEIAWAAFSVTGLLTIDIIISIYLSVNAGGNPSIAGIILRLFFIIYIYKGGQAIRKLKD